MITASAHERPHPVHPRTEPVIMAAGMTGLQVASWLSLTALFAYVSMRAHARGSTCGQNVTPQIRLATFADSVRIADTICDAFVEYRGVLVPESAALRETPESISSELRGGSGAVLAEQAGDVMGCVMVRTVESDLYFGRLAVRPRARGRGIGRVLVEAVEELARQRGHDGVRLGVRVQLAPNQHFFSTLGYQEVARSAHAGFSYPTSITMRKALTVG